MDEDTFGAVKFCALKRARENFIISRIENTPSDEEDVHVVDDNFDGHSPNLIMDMTGEAANYESSVSKFVNPSRDTSATSDWIDFR